MEVPKVAFCDTFGTVRKPGTAVNVQLQWRRIFGLRERFAPARPDRRMGLRIGPFFRPVAENPFSHWSAYGSGDSRKNRPLAERRGSVLFLRE